VGRRGSARAKLRLLVPYPALLLERKDERVLVASDLHIGWEVTLSEKGIHVPSQTPRLLERLMQLIDAHKVTRVIFLGDMKHTIAKVELSEWRDVPDFFEKLSRRVPDVTIIRGNHDGDLEALTPRSVRIVEPTGLQLWDEIGLFHGNTWPAPELLESRIVIMGHMHPVVAFRDHFNYRMIRPIWVKASCACKLLAPAFLRHRGIKSTNDPVETIKERLHVEPRDMGIIIMPAFNDFLGGQAVNRKEGPTAGRATRDHLGPVLRSGCVDLDAAEVYMLDGTYLGAIRDLRALS